MRPDGLRGDAQIEGGEGMEKDAQTRTQGRNLAQATVSHSGLSPVFRGSAGFWFTRLLGLSKRTGRSLETIAGSRLGIRSRHPLGRALTISQDIRLETGVYLRYQRSYLVPQLRRAIDFGRFRTTWCRWKSGWRGGAHITVASRSAPIE